MKNGKMILLLICSLFLGLAIGIFVGRNLTSNYVKIEANDTVIPAMTGADESDYRLDINEATKTQLMDLPGIGEVIAERIIAYRSENGAFSTIEELLEVEGIGETKLQQIEVFIRAGG